MTDIPETVRDRVKTLILMMASGTDAEVISARNLITRTLKANKVDWHDLAETMVRPVPTTPAPARPQTRFRTLPDGWWEIVSSDLLDIIATIEAETKLNPASQDFMGTLRGQCDRYPTARLSPKQYKWLDSLMLVIP